MLPIIPYAGPLRPVLMLLGIAMSICLLKRMQGRARQNSMRKMLVFAYALILLYATLLSRKPVYDRACRLEFLGSVRKAFSVEQGMLRLAEPRSLEAITINLMLMCPLGYLLPGVLEARGSTVSARRVVLFGAVLSVAIEVTQFFTGLGMLDVDDWLLNTVGAAVGYGLYRRFLRNRQRMNPDGVRLDKTGVE